MYLFTGIGRIRAVLTGGKFVARMLFSPFKPRAGQCHDSFLQNVNLCRCAKISIYIQCWFFFLWFSRVTNSVPTDFVKLNPDEELKKKE